MILDALEICVNYVKSLFVEPLRAIWKNSKTNDQTFIKRLNFIENLTT